MCDDQNYYKWYCWMTAINLSLIAGTEPTLLPSKVWLAYCWWVCRRGFFFFLGCTTIIVHLLDDKDYRPTENIFGDSSLWWFVYTFRENNEFCSRDIKLLKCFWFLILKHSFLSGGFFDEIESAGNAWLAEQILLLEVCFLLWAGAKELGRSVHLWIGCWPRS